MMEGVVAAAPGPSRRSPAYRGRQDRHRAARGRPRPHAWFTGFAPAENPKVAVAVVVEDGGNVGAEAFGGRVAAPIAKAVMQAVLGK